MAPVKIAMLLLGTIIVAACLMGMIGAATCFRLGKMPCEMPGLQQFASDAIAALMGLIAGNATRGQ
jgi:hypothetical protein